MKLITQVLGLAILVTGVAGCEGPDDTDVVPGPDGEALQQWFEDNRVAALQTFTIDAAAGGTVTGSQGTRVTFAPNAFGIEGTPVSGDVQVELIEVYDRAGMVTVRRPTNGEHGDGSVEALKSAGQFFINAVQGGADLDVLGFVMVESRLLDASEIDPEMALFRAGRDVDDNDTWQEVADPVGGQNVGVREGPDGIGVGYFYDLGEFGWTNLDRWYDFPGALTELYVQVPEGFDGDNCAVFLTYDGEPTALASLDIYDDGLGMFTEHYGLIPVGQEVHFILVTEIDDQLHYAIQGATIGEDHVETMPMPLPGNQAALELAIAALP